MGAKLFAWLGGLAGFLAVAFFVKYSFEHELIPPAVRVAIGFLLSAALVVGGLVMKGARFRITAQVLCATGIVSLYAVTFACNAVYHFPFFGTFATFLLMALVTVTAFLLAVRMNAQVIAILGRCIDRGFTSCRWRWLAPLSCRWLGLRSSLSQKKHPSR